MVKLYGGRKKIFFDMNLTIYKKAVKRRLPEISISFAICFMVFLYAPVELYLTNKNEFWFDLYSLLSVVLVNFLIFMAVCFGFFCVLHRWFPRAYHWSVIGGLIVYLSSYVQGNMLIHNLPPLDGTSINWSDYSAERIKTIAVWILVSIAVIIIYKKIKWKKLCGIVSVTSILMTLMLALTLFGIFLMEKGYESKRNVCVTYKDVFEMSNDTNFIILLLDATDATTFSNLIENNKEYENVFADFTYYDNTVCAYTFTKFSIPYILSGKWYENEEPFEEYSLKAVKESNLFKQLKDKEYDIGLYTNDLLTDAAYLLDCTNILDNKKTGKSFFAFSKEIIRMTGFKYAPFDMKRFCVVYPSAFNSLKIPVDNYEIYSDSNLKFFNSLKKEKISHTENKCFKFIHIEGAHVPLQYDKNMNIIENATYEDNVEACITISAEYLKKLKESNAYDNSVIIIMSDHGYNVTGDVYGRQNPILLIKGIGEEHDFKISSVPVSYEDLQECYSDLLDGKRGDQIFDYVKGRQRDRRYLFYKYNEENILIEYIQKGDACDMSTLTPTGREYVLN